MKTGSSEFEWIKFTTPTAQLQIHTNSALGSGDVMWTEFKEIGGLTVTFGNPPTYDIGYCIQNDVTFTMPGGNNHIWTITKYPTRLTLHCNEMEIFNYKFAESIYPDCLSKWSVEQTAFSFRSTEDTASDSYRQVPLSGKLSHHTSDFLLMYLMQRECHLASAEKYWPSN